LASIRQFATLIPHLTARSNEMFAFLVAIGRDAVLPHFKIWFASPGFRFLLSPIVELRQFFTRPIGEFAWGKIMGAVDRAAINLLVDQTKFAVVEELVKIREPLNEIGRELKLSLPLFAEALGFMLDYERITSEAIPFETAVPNLPVEFVVAVVFAGKRKGVIPLEISDRRLLIFGDYMGVDFATLDQAVEPDADLPEIPLAFWDS
jgi:hypothetical protein